MKKKAWYKPWTWFRSTKESEKVYKFTEVDDRVVELLIEGAPSCRVNAINMHRTLTGGWLHQAKAEIDCLCDDLEEFGYFDPPPVSIGDLIKQQMEERKVDQSK